MLLALCKVALVVFPHPHLSSRSDEQKLLLFPDELYCPSYETTALGISLGLASTSFILALAVAIMSRSKQNKQMMHS